MDGIGRRRAWIPHWAAINSVYKFLLQFYWNSIYKTSNCCPNNVKYPYLLFREGIIIRLNIYVGYSLTTTDDFEVKAQ